MRDKVFKKCDKIFSPLPPTLPRVKTQEFLNLIYSWLGLFNFDIFWGGGIILTWSHASLRSPPPPSVGLKMNSGTKFFDCERSERVIGEQREA